MHQLITHLASGEVELIEVPRPRPGHGELLVANEYSVVSAGTERMLVQFGAATLVGKATQQPERIRDVLHKAQKDGLGPTVAAVQARLDAPLPLGYSAVGRVLEVGEGVHGISVGDRVASNAPHAEVTLVRAALAARVPETVEPRDAAFTSLAAIALNALREGAAEVGAVIGVIGLGLIGQVAARVADAAGCRVVGFDPEPGRARSIAEGHEEPDAFVARLRLATDGAGADAVLVAADADAATMRLAADACRARGTVVLVGGGDPHLDRRAFYAKELRFVVAHAYGPGRDEEPWETGKMDYPRHRVRWTARRNFEAALDLMARGALNFEGLDRREVAFAEAGSVYADLRAGAAAVATIFRYDARVEAPDLVSRHAGPTRTAGRGVAVIGAGNFASRVLVPALKDAGAGLRIVASRGGLSASLLANKHGFGASTTNLEHVWADDEAVAVFISTQHDSHVELAVAALQAGKHVWLEKPAAIRREELAKLERAVADTDRVVMVGFNRRFAATATALRAQMRGHGPFSVVYVVNAGALPADHWLDDPDRGGGRLVGEACHFVDLLRHLVDAPITAARAVRSGESAALSFEFADGSIGTVHYLTGGHPSVSKERIEVFGNGRVWQLDNFRSVSCVDGGLHPAEMLKRLAPGAQDKGHDAAVRAFLDAVATGASSPVPFSESAEVSRAIFDALGL